MEAYLSPVDSEAGDVRRIVIDGPTGLYRSGYDVVAETPDQMLELGVRDVTVSRKGDNGAPVEFAPSRNGVDVRNEGSTNPVVLSQGVENREIEIAAGEERYVDEECLVSLGVNTELHLGFDRNETLSVDELKDQLGLEQQGSLVSGVDPALYAQSLADNLLQARHESANECLQYANELNTFLLEHPVEDGAYEDVCEELERTTRRLETKVSNDLGGLDAEWDERIERLAHRVERVYARGNNGQ
jgi:hypothetical protein